MYSIPPNSGEIRLQKQFLATICKHGMITCGDTVVLGLSGGADSMCLLHILLGLRESYEIDLVCVHVNHGIRQEAACDEEFVQDFCRAQGVDLQVYHVDAKAYATDNKISLETAGRELRYRCFDAVASKLGAPVKIATAHNRNDLAETVLMRLLRGTGALGLGGIAPVRGNLIRPLIEFSRKEIEDYNAKHGLLFLTDLTNQSNNHTRNKLRNEAIPYITREFNPNIVDTLARSSALISCEENFLDQTAHYALGDCLTERKECEVVLSIPVLLGLHTAIIRRVLRNALGLVRPNNRDISYAHIEAVLAIAHGQTGKKTTLAGGLIVEKVYDRLNISLYTGSVPQGFAYDLELDVPIYIPEICKYALASQHKPDCRTHIICQSFRYTQPLTLRTKQDGDKIFLSKIGGTAKIKDYFIDKKIPRDQRRKIPLLAHGSDILWIIGEYGQVSDKYLPLPDLNAHTMYVSITEVCP